MPVCPNCAQPAEQPLLCERCAWRWHANPKPAAAVLLERADENGDASVVLLRRAVDPGFGSWDLPAGYLEPGESFEDGARREAREETGLEVRLLSIAGVYHSASVNAVTVAYRAAPVDPHAAVAIDSESSAHEWVPRIGVEGWLPRMAFRSMAAALSDWAAGRIGGPSTARADEPPR